MLLKDIAYVMDIIQTRNLSRSAERLFVTQPTLTQAVRRMEEHLQVSLFRRTKSGMEPTQAGLLFAEYAQDILSQCEHMRERITGTNPGKEMHLRIGVAKMYAKFINPFYITPFCQKFPDINVEIVEDRASPLEMKLLNNELDLCILATPLESNLLEGIPLFCEELLVALSTDDPLYIPYESSSGDFPEIDISHLKNEYFIIPKEGYRLYQLFLNMCTMLGFWPKRIIEIESVDTIFDFVRNHRGIGIVSDLFAKYSIPNKSIQCYHIKNASSKRLFMVIFPRGKKLSYMAKEFVATLGRQQ